MKHGEKKITKRSTWRLENERQTLTFFDVRERETCLQPGSRAELFFLFFFFPSSSSSSPLPSLSLFPRFLFALSFLVRMHLVSLFICHCQEAASLPSKSGPFPRTTASERPFFFFFFMPDARVACDAFLAGIRSTKKIAKYSSRYGVRVINR
ncbi:hypothetical protein LZ30DRAFT_118209 [Colletotrichum cereale]|nr:hypothetical protein LZ30DRAFT_118209 [Colletotrichum cereale]